MERYPPTKEEVPEGESTMDSLTINIVNSVWMPLSHHFRHAIREATEKAFVGRKMFSTTSGETVLLEDVLDYNRKAEGPLTSAFQKLDLIGRSDIVNLIRDLYPALLPYFIGCGTKNPVHHTAYVMDFMVTILIGEEEHKCMKTGVLAALFHDAGQGRSKLPKITEANIIDKILQVANGKATLDDLEKYGNDAKKARLEHMEEGVKIADRILTKYKKQHPGKIKDGEIQQIMAIIQHHDDPKIPVAYSEMRREFDKNEECTNWREGLSKLQKQRLDDFLNTKVEKYLIKAEDWLLQYHHEADLLWMLTPDGIDADLARFSPSDEKTPEDMKKHNIGLHHSEIEVYRCQPNFCEYKFQNDTAYRSDTGYRLFKHLSQVLEERYPSKNCCRRA
jgi:hypothetical protein